MNASFPASAAAAQSYVVDAVMLGSAFLDSLGAECRTLGLAGCWRSKGTLGEGVQVSSTGTLRVASATGAGTTSAISSIGTISTTAIGTRASSMPSAAPSAPPAPASSVGLSTAVKAGIGAGVAIGILLLLVTAIFLSLKRRKRSQENTQSTTPEKVPNTATPRSCTTELQAQRGPYADAELEGSAASSTYPHPYATQQALGGNAELAGPNKAPTVEDLRGTYGYGELASGAERHELYGSDLRK
jgi:hypothetical protein